jgi:hypothetical protein
MDAWRSSWGPSARRLRISMDSLPSLSELRLNPLVACVSRRRAILQGRITGLHSSGFDQGQKAGNLGLDVAASFAGLSQLLLGSGLPTQGVLDVGSEQLFRSDSRAIARSCKCSPQRT